MKKNIFKPVILGVLTVFLLSLLISSCSKKTPTLNAPVPTASFTYNTPTPTSDSTAQNLELINTSTNSMTASWVIVGIGSYSGDTVKVAIPNAGTYTVKMAASGPGGLSDTISQQVTISQNNPYTVKAAFTYQFLTPTSFTNSQNLKLINTSQYSVSASWSITDANGNNIGTFTGDTVAVTIANAGTYSVTLTATGRYNVTNTVTQTVTITEDNPYGDNPNSIINVLTGAGMGLTQRTWQMPGIPGFLSLGGSAGSNGYYAVPGTAADNANRISLLSDTYTFQAGTGGPNAGEFIFNNAGLFFNNNGAIVPLYPSGSYHQDTLLANVSGSSVWTSGTFQYLLTTTGGAAGLGQITVQGLGAHIGLLDQNNQGVSETPVATSITYDIWHIGIDQNPADANDPHDTLTLTMSEAGGSIWYNYILVSQ